jgi:hypothetical protein
VVSPSTQYGRPRCPGAGNEWRVHFCRRHLTLTSPEGCCTSEGVPLVIAVLLLTPDDAPTALADTLRQACVQVLGEGACVVDPAEVDGAPAMRVEVRWADDAFTAARIFVSPWGDATPCAVRDVGFAPGDRLEDRFRATGLLVAAMVMRCHRDAAEVHDAGRDGSSLPPGEAGATPAPGAMASPPDAARPSSWRPRFDLAAVGGSGFVGPLPRWGVRGLGALVARDVPWAPYVDTDLAWERDGITSVRWWSASAGVLLRVVEHAGLRVEAVVGVVAERLWLAARADGASDDASLWRLGARFGGTVGLEGERGGVFLGGEGVVLTPAIDVEVAGEARGTSERLGFRVFAGVRLFP